MIKRAACGRPDGISKLDGRRGARMVGQWRLTSSSFSA